MSSLEQQRIKRDQKQNEMIVALMQLSYQYPVLRSCWYALVKTHRSIT